MGHHLGYLRYPEAFGYSVTMPATSENIGGGLEGLHSLQYLVRRSDY
jgi:hypothetical protein